MNAISKVLRLGDIYVENGNNATEILHFLKSSSIVFDLDISSLSFSGDFLLLFMLCKHTNLKCEFVHTAMVVFFYNIKYEQQ